VRKTKLLVVTCSTDGTVDRVLPLLQSESLRINLDVPQEWSFTSDLRTWEVKVGNQVCTAGDDAFVWWWKPELDETRNDSYYIAEVNYQWRELYHLFRARGRAKGSDYLHHHFKGKSHYLKAATGFFKTPETRITFNSHPLTLPGRVVAKSLASTPFSSNEVLYTTEVSISSLDFRSHWFLQELIDAEFDVTVLIVRDTLLAFERKRRVEGSLDWRQEQDFRNTARDWLPAALDTGEARALRAFVEKEGLEWGRIDFMRSNSGQLFFLEYNANGQFGFLDPQNEFGVFTVVADYLSNPSPGRTIR
jgi:hypothetical protein